MKLSSFLFLLFFSLSVNAQKTQFTEYDWSTFPNFPKTDTLKIENGSIIQLERRINEIYLNKEDMFEEIEILHRKIKVQSNDAINSFNKFYIPVNNAIEILNIKARFISPNGKISNVPKESIRPIENLENKGNFQTFAIEGVEIGGEIEYFYTLRKKFDPYGTITIQGSDPKINIESIFAFPSKLEFFVKSYNGFPDFVLTEDSLTKTKFLKAYSNYIPSIEEEEYSAYSANMMRYEYTLNYNNYSSALRIYSFAKVAATIYSNLYETNKSEDAAVKEVLNKMQYKGMSVEERIRFIENWLKTEMVITEDLSETPSIDEMLKIKQATKHGMMRMMVALLNQLSIKFETVISCNQSERKFDPEFNGWNYLNDYLIYFPELNSIIKPEDPSYRLGIIPSAYQGSFGLFLHPISYAEDLNTLAYNIGRIPEINFKNNSDTLLINLNLNFNNMNVEADIHRVFTGELASGFQSFWSILDANRQKEIVSEMFSMGNQTTIINSFDLQNYSPDKIGVLPLIWNVKLSANSLIEQAGDDILVKIGESIGEQKELYQQSIRKLPIYVGSLHNYFRKIEFEIPSGYIISNLEDLKIRTEMFYKGKVSCCFISDYEVKGNKLYIYSTEYYSELEYPVEEFESFRSVVNAAADFNKKTILLTKK